MPIPALRTQDGRRGLPRLPLSLYLAPGFAHDPPVYPFGARRPGPPSSLEIRGWVRSELVLSVGRGFSPTGRPSTLPPLWLVIRSRITRAVRSTSPAYRVALWAPPIASRAMGYAMRCNGAQAQRIVLAACDFPWGMAKQGTSKASA